MQQEPISKNNKMRRFWMVYIAAWLGAILLYALNYLG